MVLDGTDEHGCLTALSPACLWMPQPRIPRLDTMLVASKSQIRRAWEPLSFPFSDFF